MTTGKVYSAQTLDEIRAIEVHHEAKGFKYHVARFLIGVWVTLANGVVAILKLCLFGRNRLPKEAVRNIVAYGAGTLGDNVVIFSALAALRQAFPGAALNMITNATGYDPGLAKNLFAEARWLNRVVVCSDDPVKREGFRIRVTYPATQIIPCDLFVNLSRFGNSGWLGAVLRELIFAKWLGARWVIGFRINAYNRHGRLLNKLKHHFVRNEPRRAAQVLKEIGLVPDDSSESLPRSAAGINSIMAKLESRVDGRPIFVINPGAKFKIQCWPPERFAALAVHLRREYNAWVVVTGSAPEKELGDEILRLSGNVGMNLAGQTSVQELIELLRLSAACITNDTGTMHIAAELGKPTIAIFTTRMSPTAWFPKGKNVIAVFSFGVDSYTYKDDGDAPCECLTRIEVDDVLTALRKVLPSKSENEEKIRADGKAGRDVYNAFPMPP